MLFFVEVEADVGLRGQAGANDFENVLRSDIASEGDLVDGYRRPIKGAVLLPARTVSF